MHFQLEPLLAFSIFGVVAVSLVIWALRHEQKKDDRHLTLLKNLAEILGGNKEIKSLQTTFELHGITYKIGITHGGESDPTRLFVSCEMEPFADAIIYILQTGINRWFSKKLKTGDQQFDKRVYYQVQIFQKGEDRHGMPVRLCDDANFRAALLHISETGYSCVTIPGTWQTGSKTAKFAGHFVQVNRNLAAYVNNPKPRDFEPEKIRVIAEALADIAKVVETDRSFTQQPKI